MKYILGMAKSPLDAGGVKSRNLELDFLRLIYAVEHYRAKRTEAQGYLLVLTEQLRKRATTWIEKYDSAGSVEIVLPLLDQAQERLLREEKERNRSGNASRADKSLASASYGERLGEDLLVAHIKAVEPLVTDLGWEHGPYRVRWDYFGIVGSMPNRAHVPR